MSWIVGLVGCFSLVGAGLWLGIVFRRREVRAQHEVLERAARSARLQLVDGEAVGRREGLDLRVILSRMGAKRLVEINYGFHRLGATLRFSVHSRAKPWSQRWRVEEPLVSTDWKPIEQLAWTFADDPEVLFRVFEEPDVARAAVALLERAEVCFFSVDLREVFAVMVELGDDTDLGAILEDGLALCALLTTAAPAGGGRARRLESASAASGSPFGVPSVAPRRQRD